MVLERLGNAIKSSFTKISNAIFLDKKLVDSIIKEIQRALIEADVNVELVFQLSQKIKKVAYDENIKGIDKKEQLVKLIHDEIEKIITPQGTKSKSLELKLPKKAKILFLGLYGAGKTTTISKIGFYYAKRGKKVALLGLDTQRPAAMDQLEQMAEKAKLPAFVDKKEKNPLKIYEKYKKELEKYDLVLIDTAGRDSLKDDLVKEIKSIDKKLKPDYRILVMPADIGQAAKKQASDFQNALDIDGVIITRMDGTAKAGGALTACAETNAPVFFIGTGEHIHDIEKFNPSSFISRILGMGDLNALLEKVHSATSKKQQERIQKSLEEGKFTLADLYSQLESMGQMGGMDKMLSMIPGMGAQTKKLSPDMLKKQEQKLKHFKSAIQSMTQDEINNPEILEKQTSRIKRIAKGSGTTTSEIRELLKQYKMMNDMIKMQSSLTSADGQPKLDQKTLQKLAKRFKGKMKF